MTPFLVLLVSLCVSEVISEESRFSIRMPGVVPKHADHYLCTHKELPEGQHVYVTGYEPLANKSVAHHMLLFACRNMPKHAESTDGYFDCHHGVCDGPQRIVYAWGLQAPPLNLPPDVSFDLGGDGPSQFRHLVLQVHYLKPLQRKDRSGVTLKYRSTPTKYKVGEMKNIEFEDALNCVPFVGMTPQAGILLVANSVAVIPPHQRNFGVDAACRYSEDGNGPNLYPFAFRTHAHMYSRNLLGYVKDADSRGGALHEIGHANPHWPQTFYPAHSNVVIRPGDTVMARCVYDSTASNHEIRMGQTHADEMCNFYTMFSYDRSFNSPEERCIEVLPFNGGDLFPADSLVHMPKAIPKGFFPNTGLTAGNSYSNSVAEGFKSFEETIEEEKDNELKEVPNTKLSWTCPNWSVRAVRHWRVHEELGQVSGVCSDLGSKKRVVVFHRGEVKWDDTAYDYNDNLRNPRPVLQSQPVLHVNTVSGQVEESWGSGLFFMPHGIFVDSRHGHVYTTDVGSHTVLRFRYGKWDRPDLVLGTHLVHGNDPSHFCKPTDVATNAKGDIFVADGYCNARVVKFSSEGVFLKEWGSSAGRFRVLHSLVVMEKLGWVCVADRERAAIECFDFEGNVQRRWKSDVMGDAVYGLAWDDVHERLLGISIIGNLPQPKEAFGFSIPLSQSCSSQHQQLGYNQTTSPTIYMWDTEFALSAPHALTVTADGENIFVAQLDHQKVVKFRQVNRSEDKPEKKK